MSDAILLALGNNESFRVERLGPSIAGTFVDELRAAFDPLLSAAISRSKTVSTRIFGSTPGGPLGTSRAGLLVTQSLLQGFGISVNLATLRQARIDAENSQYVLRGYAETLVAQVEEAYWD